MLIYIRNEVDLVRLSCLHAGFYNKTMENIDVDYNNGRVGKAKKELDEAFEAYRALSRLMRDVLPMDSDSDGYPDIDCATPDQVLLMRIVNKNYIEAIERFYSEFHRLNGRKIGTIIRNNSKSI